MSHLPVFTGGARGIGRGALLEQLTEMGVRPAARGRGILSPEWGKSLAEVIKLFHAQLFHAHLS